MNYISLLAILAVVCGSNAVDVEKVFKENQIVPDMIPVPPKKALNIKYASGVTVDFGKELTPTQVKDMPTVTWEAEKGAYYTISFSDPDAPSRVNHTVREFRQWLVMNIPETAVEKGDHIFEYRGSAGAKGSGIHRYVFLVYKQPSGIINHTEPRSSYKQRTHRRNTSALVLAKKYNLGDPQFGNFFQAQWDPYVDTFQAQSVE